MGSNYGFFDAKVVPPEPRPDIQPLTPVWVLLEAINVRVPGMPRHIDCGSL